VGTAVIPTALRSRTTTNCSLGTPDSSEYCFPPTLVAAIHTFPVGPLTLVIKLHFNLKRRKFDVSLSKQNWHASSRTSDAVQKTESRILQWKVCFKRTACLIRCSGTLSYNLTFPSHCPHTYIGRTLRLLPLDECAVLLWKKDMPWRLIGV
jgi:hypothetical protein